MMGAMAAARRYRLELGQRRLGALRVARDEDDARAHRRQLDDRDFADARRRAGRDHGLALHGAPLSAFGSNTGDSHDLRVRASQNCVKGAARLAPSRAPIFATVDRNMMEAIRDKFFAAAEGKPESMAKDQQGLTLAGSPDSAAAFDRAVADYYGLTGDPVGVLKSALARDPGFALGGVAIAALFMIGGFRGDHPEVMSALGAAEAAIGGASARERRHLTAAKAWAEGETFQATLGWETFWPITRPTRSPCAWRRTPISFSAGRRDPRFRRPRAAGVGSRQSAYELRPGALRLRA